MKKNRKRILENIEILDFAAEGKCIVKDEGEVVFVEGSNVCPGDEVKLIISKAKKRFSEGRVLKINKYDDREIFLNKLLAYSDKVNFNILGINSEEPKWNYDYYNELKKVKLR